MAVLTVEGIQKSFSGVDVLRDISFSLEKGEALAIIGSSGSGKTTLLRCLNFLETPDKGVIRVGDQVIFNAEDPRSRSEQEIRQQRLHFGLVFQSFNLFPQYTVLENVTLAGRLLAKERPDFKSRKAAIYREIEENGKALLDSFLPVYVHTLLSEENQDYVAEIIIEGHADMSGDYLSNLNLSQQRALSVVSYFLSDTFYGLTAQEKEQLRSIVTANGRSWVAPVYNEDGTVNMEASRRVEFKFRLKDAEMIAEMSSILEQND